MALITLQIEKNSGGEDWFSSRHDPSKGLSGSILRLLFVCHLFLPISLSPLNSNSILPFIPPAYHHMTLLATFELVPTAIMAV